MLAGFASIRWRTTSSTLWSCRPATSLPGAPAFDPKKQTAAAQAKQFGFNVDYLALLDLDHDRLVLVANHEYTSEQVMFAGYSAANPTREQVEVGWGDVEGGIVGGRTWGSSAAAYKAQDFLFVALLDGDRRASVQYGLRRGDDERDAAACGGQRE